MPRSGQSQLTPSHVLQLRVPYGTRLSPDGRWVAYVERTTAASRHTYREELRVVDAVTGAVRVAVPKLDAEGAPAWAPDSRTLVFATRLVDATGLWRLRIETGKVEQLTIVDGNARAVSVSPDGRRVAFLHTPLPGMDELGTADEVPVARVMTRIDDKQDGRGFRDGAFSQLMVLDLATGRKRSLTSGDADVADPAWSPDSRQLAFVSNRSARADVQRPHADVYVVGAAGGRIRALTSAMGPKHAPAWSPDGRRIAYMGHRGFPDAVENLHVWIVDASGGKPRDLMAASDLMCGDSLLTDVDDVDGPPPAPLWSPRGDRLFVLASQRGETQVWEVTVANGAARPRTAGRHGICQLSQSRGASRWAFVRRTPTEPGDVFVATAGGTGRRSRMVPGAGVKQLTKLNTWLRRYRLPVPEEIRVKCVPGHEVHGWILRATGAPERRPTVVAIHGGPYLMYGWSFFFEFQMLASQGYHVVFTNLRGSAGYGRNFMRALVGNWGHSDHEDLMRVTDTIERLPFVDAARIAVAGGSYGGYLTAWAIANTQRFKCAVSMRGVTNLFSMFGTCDIGPELLPEFEGQLPWHSFDRWWRVSPLARAGAIRTPLLLLHGEQDHRCPIGQSEELFTALRVLGREVEFVRFPGESHALTRSGRPRARAEHLRRTLGWYQRKL